MKTYNDGLEDAARWHEQEAEQIQNAMTGTPTVFRNRLVAERLAFAAAFRAMKEKNDA